MKKPDCILVPVDYSAASLAALDFGILIAEQFKSKLVLLSVEREDFIDEAFMIFSLDLADDVKRLREMVERRAAADQAAIPRENVKVMVKTGAVVQQILRTAKDTRADMIIMGTHGRGWLARAVLGSVTEQVIRGAPCPVLAIRAEMAVPKGKSAAHALAHVEAEKKWLGGE